MTEAETFLTAIIAQPDDDTVRLVYADWLTEYGGDPDRGEFIRTQIELARTPPDCDATNRRRAVLFGREAELLKKHKKTWLAPFVPYARESSFERGFVQAVELPAKAFVERSDGWYALAPITRVKITEILDYDRATQTRTSWAPNLFTSPHLSRVTALDLYGQALTAADLEPLAEHPDLSRLRELVLVWNRLGNDGATLLANMAQLSGLEALDLSSNGITDPGARAIALGRYFDNLKELRIARNSIHNAAWALLEDRFGSALAG